MSSSDLVFLVLTFGLLLASSKVIDLANMLGNFCHCIRFNFSIKIDVNEEIIFKYLINYFALTESNSFTLLFVSSGINSNCFYLVSSSSFSTFPPLLSTFPTLLSTFPTLNSTFPTLLFPNPKFRCH